MNIENNNSIKLSNNEINIIFKIVENYYQLKKLKLSKEDTIFSITSKIKNELEKNIDIKNIEFNLRFREFIFD